MRRSRLDHPGTGKVPVMDLVWLVLLVLVVLIAVLAVVVAIQRRRRAGGVLSIDTVQRRGGRR